MRIAVDISIYIYKMMSVAIKEVVDKTNLRLHDPDRQAILQKFLIMIIAEVQSFISNEITPILVFDGDTHPQKLATKNRNTKTEEKALTIEQLKQKVRNPIGGVALDADVKELADKIKSTTRLSYSEKMMFFQTFKDLDIPCIMAKHDAEKLCASLAIEGIAAAAYTTDSDVLVCGAPLWLNKREWVKDEKGQDVQVFSGYFLEEILVTGKLTFDQFQNVCIFAGIDFNEGTKPKGSGIITSYNHFCPDEKGLTVDDMKRKYGDKFQGFYWEICKTEIFNIDVWENLIHEKENGSISVIATSFNITIKNIFTTGAAFLLKYRSQEFFMSFVEKLSKVPKPKSVPCRPPIPVPSLIISS